MTLNWHVQLINYIFNLVDAQRILQIPLNFQAFDDFVEWHLNKNDIFTVRTSTMLNGYISMGPMQMLSQGRKDVQHLVYGDIFGNYMPQVKFKYVIGSNMHIGTNGSCNVCNFVAENLRHMLFQFTNARSCGASWDSWT